MTLTIVTPNLNGAPDLIGRTGIVVPTRSVPAWCEAIKKAMTMKTGSDARIRVISKHSPEIRFKKIAGILDET